MFQSRRKANTYRNIGVLSVLAVFSLLLLGLAFASEVVIWISILPLIASAYFFLDHYSTWSIGAEGEEKVAKCLDRLDGGYHIIHDVVLPGETGNIDHIVLGSEGIFVIETKNHKGYITCKGDWWIQRKIGEMGTPYLGNIGNPSKQVKRNAVLLSKFIQKHFGVDLFINGIVVFTNGEARLKIMNPTVAVLRPEELCDFIQHYRSKTFKDIRFEELAEGLKPYSCFS